MDIVKTNECIFDVCHIFAVRKLYKEDREEFKKNYKEVYLENCKCMMIDRGMFYAFDNDFKYLYSNEQMESLKKIIDKFGYCIDHIYYKSNMPLFIVFGDFLAMLAPRIEGD